MHTSVKCFFSDTNRKGNTLIGARHSEGTRVRRDRHGLQAYTRKHTHKHTHTHTHLTHTDVSNTHRRQQDPHRGPFRRLNARPLDTRTATTTTTMTRTHTRSLSLSLPLSPSLPLRRRYLYVYVLVHSPAGGRACTAALDAYMPLDAEAPRNNIVPRPLLGASDMHQADVTANNIVPMT